MITIRLKGMEIVCSTAVEAAEVARLMSASTLPKATPSPSAPVYASQPMTLNLGGAPRDLQGVTSQEKSDVDELIDVMKHMPSGEIESSYISTKLGLQSVNGLGPRLGGLRKRFQEIYNVSLDDLLVRVGRPGMPAKWKVNRDALDAFLDHRENAAA